MRRSRKKARDEEGDLVKVNFRIPMREYEEMLLAVKTGSYSSISELVRHALERLVLEYREGVHAALSKRR
ncbi:MAG: ribbon-helix-helix domain-containing protein [Thermofilum sp.]|jgi:Arc/MetJ-type ribon-helix-helix transcriptional regulator|nr:ribbon-helix-helix domain-containing protein [Thermofilum sp.]MCC6058947.1 ribbon-helix-helix domain-containing protein [Thermofilum sp.]